MLNLKFVTCLICDRDLAMARDAVQLDRSVETQRGCLAFYKYRVPPARHRDMIAPDLCDFCWVDHINTVQRTALFRKSTYCPPFSQYRLWAYVAKELNHQGQTLRKHQSDKGNDFPKCLDYRARNPRQNKVNWA